jgi:hypothetical protein
MYLTSILTRPDQQQLGIGSTLEELFPGLEDRIRAEQGQKRRWQHRDGRLYDTSANQYLHLNTTKPDLEYEENSITSWLKNAECLQSADTQTILQVLRKNAGDFGSTGFKSLDELNLESIHDSADDLQTMWASRELAGHFETYPHLLTKEIVDHRSGLLLLYGIGQGHLIGRLMQALQPRVVLIFESDLELLALRLNSEACELILQAADQTGCSIFLVTDSEPSLAHLKAKALIESVNLFAQERLFSFHCRQTDWATDLDERFRTGDSMLRDLRYLGFFVDELHMMLNASICLTQTPPRIISYRTIDPHQSHAVITASGPSLAEGLPKLHQLRPQFDLFCCYSTLGALLQSALTPDYHCNQERHNCHIPILNDPASHSYASTGLLLCSANNDPRMNGLYRDVVAFFRSASSASALYAPSADDCISGEGPQVANLALYYAILMGYRTLHLFGVDLGCVNQQNPRAGGALSHSPRHLNKPAPGNRRETIWTDQSLLECAEFMGNLISGILLPGAEPIQGLRVFNYSDGQKIPGTVSAHPEEFSQNLQGSSPGPAPLELVQKLGRYDSQIARARFLAFDWRRNLSEYLAAVQALIAEPLNREHHEQFLQLSERQLNSLHDQVLPRMLAGTLARIWYLILMVDARLQKLSTTEQKVWQQKATFILEESIASMEKLLLEMVDYIERLESIDNHKLQSRIFG